MTTDSPNLDRTLTRRILYAMVAAAFLGTITHVTGLTGNGVSSGVQTVLVDNIAYLVGRAFVYLLQMLVVPLVFTSLVCGMASIADGTRVGRMGIKTVGLYLCTTLMAVVMALVVGQIVQPGEGAGLQITGEVMDHNPPSFKEVLLGMIPRNPVAALADGAMLQIIVFALMLGYAMTLTGDAGNRTRSLFEDLNQVCMRLVFFVVSLAPYGAFALLFTVFANTGPNVFGDLAAYFFTLLFLLVMQFALVYSFLLRVFTGLSPLQLVRQMRPAMLFAFTTSSSNATLPITLTTLLQRVGVKREVASFTLPIGATVNMDGTAIMQGIAVVFIANAYGIDLSIMQYLQIIALASLISIGTAGVPSAGLIMLSTVLTQVGLPLEGIGVILAVDRLLDMCRTVVNITGDSVVTTIIGKSEGAFDEKVFNTDHDA